jgi:hypothetical protein
VNLKITGDHQSKTKLKGWKPELTKFTSFFARETSRKLSVLLLVFGTSFFYLSTANAVNTGPATITCADPDGVEKTFNVGWDNSQSFFDGKGDIARLFCEGGYAGAFRTFVSTSVTDMSLRFYNGVAPVESPTVVVEPTPEPSPSPSPSETSTVESTPSETETAPVAETTTVVSPTPPANDTSTPVSENTDSSTVTQDTPTAVVETPTVVDTSTATSQPPIIPEPTPIVVPEPPVVRPEPVATPDPPAPAPQPEPQPEPQPVPAPEPDPVPEPAPEPVPVEDPSPEPAPEPDPIPEPEPLPDPIPEPAPEPEPEVVPEPVPEPELIPELAPEPPIVEPVDTTPEVVVLSAETDLRSLAPDTPVELENGVILTAEVVIALQLLEDPIALLGELFSNPAEVFTALSNIGADMSPEVREQSEKVVVAAVIVGNIATQAAASAAGVAAYRRKP